MADFYRIGVGQLEGTGTISINSVVVSEGGVPSSVFIEEATTVEVEIVPDSGYNSFSASVAGFTFITSPFTFTMPSRDVRLSVTFAGTFEPVDGYQDKYVFDRVDIRGNSFELKIQQDGYSGSPITDFKLNRISYVWNKRGTNLITEQVIPSYIDFTIRANLGDFKEFLEGNNRTFRTILNIDSNRFFEGYVTPDVINYRINDQGYDNAVTFRAVDGLNTLDFARAIGQRWGGTLSALQAKIGLFGALNQTYIEKRALNIACELYETRMNTALSAWVQFLTADQAYYEGGNFARFEEGTRFINETLKIKECIKRIIAPFVGRLYLWENEFYFSRYGDYQNANMKYFRFDENGNFDEDYTLSNDAQFDCINNKSIDHNRTFTEFQAFLKLGELLPSTIEGEFSVDFDSDDWEQFGQLAPGGLEGSWRLRNWSLTNMVAYNVNESLSSQLGSNTARVGWVTQDGNFARIYNTTTQSGLSDPNISFMNLQTAQTGLNLFLVQELANTFSVNVNYRAVRREETDPLIPVNASFGLLIRVGSNWLSFDSITNTFSWVSSQNVMLFPIDSPSGALNKLEISNIPVPESAEMEIRIYQLVIGFPTGAHRYFLDIGKFELAIERNEDLNLGEVGAQANTVTDFNNVFERYDIFQGDVATGQSTAAIRLMNLDVTSLWSRDGVEELPLLSVVVQEIANLYGKPNWRLTGVTGTKPDPRRSWVYLGVTWIITYVEWDIWLGEYRIEMFSIDGELE